MSLCHIVILGLSYALDAPIYTLLGFRNKKMVSSIYQSTTSKEGKSMR